MNLFNSIPLLAPKSHAFNLSHERLTTMNMGELIPIFCEQVLPGDKFKQRTEILVRMAPSLAPIMHRVNVFTHFFFVPNRLIWKDWERFITQGSSGEVTVKYPTIDIETEEATYLEPGSLAEHLGFQSVSPNTVVQNTSLDALPFRAYQLIYDTYYRDQNLTTPITETEYRNLVSDTIPSNVIRFGSGSESAEPALVTLRKRAWEKDYFTSALTSPQRGGDVQLPMAGGDAPVVLNRNSSGSLNAGLMVNSSGSPYRDRLIGPASSGNLAARSVSSPEAVDGPATYDPNGTLVADMSEVTASTINDLRRAVKLQEFLEKNARGGSRYIEQILSHFGVRSSDARLQRPQYLGGGISPIIVSEVLQQSESSQNSPLGKMAGHGMSAQVTHQFKHFFEEHGLIIGIMSIMPKPVYMTGTRRQFLRRDPYDFYFPEFAHLGEQAIVADEIFTDYAGDGNKGQGLDPEKGGGSSVFGYTPRFAEYKYIPSSVHGEFLTNLNYWHLARNFTSVPTLTNDFVTKMPGDRAWPDTTDYSDKFWVQIYHHIKAVRRMPKFGVPSF